jgi:hypothetical protein
LIEGDRCFLLELERLFVRKETCRDGQITNNHRSMYQRWFSRLKEEDKNHRRSVNEKESVNEHEKYWTVFDSLFSHNEKYLVVAASTPLTPTDSRPAHGVLRAFPVNVSTRPSCPSLAVYAFLVLSSCSACFANFSHWLAASFPSEEQAFVRVSPNFSFHTANTPIADVGSVE